MLLITKPRKFFKKSLEAAGLWLVALAVKALYMTLRVEIDGRSREILTRDESSVLIVWHNRISVMPYIKTRYRSRYGVTGLVSPSKDGDVLTRFFSHFGITTERGSSSSGGARAAIKLIRTLREGGHICITPDGPRGPKYEIKEGVMAICAKTQSRIIFSRIEMENSWKFRSWDEFRIPKPFSRLTIKADEFDNYGTIQEKAAQENMPVIDFAGKMLGR